MTEFFSVISSVLAITGVVLNNRLNITCFYLWIVSNVICAIIHAFSGLYVLAGKDLIFFLLAIHGLWSWSQKKSNVSAKNA